MNKPFTLRTHLLERTPWLNVDPTRLATYVENGHLVAKGGGSPSPFLSYEHQYKLTLVVLDFPGDPEEIIVPIYEWLTVNQPDFMHNPEWQKSGFTFEIEVTSKSLYDMTISLMLTERIIGKIKDENATISADRYDIKAVDEPQYADLLRAINPIDPDLDPTLDLTLRG